MSTTSIPAQTSWTIADQIGQAYSEILNITREHLVDEDVTTSEFVALVILHSMPQGISQSELAIFQGVARQRAHSITNRLTTAGLLQVERLGRSSTVSLTTKGHKLVARLEPTLSAAYSAHFSGLTPTEAKQLTVLLSKLSN